MKVYECRKYKGWFRVMKDELRSYTRYANKELAAEAIKRINHGGMFIGGPEWFLS